MTPEKRTVSVKKLPPSPDLDRRLLFLDEVENSIAQRRPLLVLDCSCVRELDESALHMLLHCLEVALRRNGDVKLAALPAAAAATFAAAGLERLFDLYDTTGEAVASFHHLPTTAPPSAAVSPLLPAEA
ncbi:MAG TPA: STAS domain-containing protein [Acidobacteriaceae bacterium]|jgi:anti-anti-sigma factor|nr:STAS domain-containing protein [Acidobacteriaceae bacterium]